MNTFAQPIRLVRRLWRSLFHSDTPSSSDDPYVKYKARIPNRASRRALEELKHGEFKEFDNLDDLVSDLNDD